VTAARIARVLALFALLSPLWLGEQAEAQRRDFVGRVQSVSAESIAVKDRRGNVMSFARAENTQVEGKSWEAIAQGDEVLVRWNLGSGVARRVIVLGDPAQAPAR
jgi:hypothetical protein